MNMHPPQRYRNLLIGLALLAATLAVYAQVKDHDFIDFDDEEYIVANPHVRTGLTAENVIWAFTSAHSNNWHPLTWISHMVDVELFGLRPAGHHLVNVLLHAVNAVLLFLLFSRMTGSPWRSAFVAALFALHPLHVESVAWAAERKDVLSTLFWFLTLWMYLLYVQKRSWKRYSLVLICFAAGLMAKQMLVTLPFVMLLLDFWPLGRLCPETTDAVSAGGMGPAKQWPKTAPGKKFRHDQAKSERSQRQIQTRPRFGPPSSRGRSGGGWGLVVEKIPLFMLAALASVAVFVVQLQSGVLYNLNPFPLQARMENAIVSYVAYAGKMFWPEPLAVFYPHPLHSLPLWQVFGALALLILITVICWKYRHKRYLGVGWFWYLGTLVPVIGLVQVGVQAMADRYAYIPLTGLLIMLAWGIPDMAKQWPYRKAILAILSTAVILSCLFLTWKQTGIWKNGMALYAHAARVIPGNYWAYNNLGAALATQGDLEKAAAYFAKSLEIMPMYPGANKNMAVYFFKKDRFQEAIPYLEKALAFQPANPEYRVIMGLTLMKLGRIAEAREQFAEALRIRPGYPDAREAMQETLTISPRDEKHRKGN